MPTTSKMGIVYPSSSDLVKDGATNMGTIATTVDSKTGLVLIKSATFSAVASLSLDANTFSSNYDFYKVFISGAASTDNGLVVRLRAAGSDNSTSNYGFTGVYTNNAAGPTRISSAGFATQMEVGTVGVNGFSSEITFFYPNNTSYRTFIHGNTFAQYSTGDRDTRFENGYFNGTTQFDSATIFPTGGNFSGRYCVFGVNQ